MLIAKAAAADLVQTLDVGDGVLECLIGHEETAVLGGAQRHDLHDGHRNIRPGGRGLIAPAPFAILAADDELDGLLQDRLDLFIARHAPKFRESQRGHGVAVHVAAAGADQVAVGPR